MNTEIEERINVKCDFTGHPCNPNAFVAFNGLRAMGYECIFFRDMKNSLQTTISKKNSLLAVSA